MAHYSDTEMWVLFTEKAKSEKLSQDFIDAVGKICQHGAILSKTVIAFFPTFTLHDDIHLSNVSDWMLRLLGDCKNALSAKDLACLLMAAWCHDIGMTVSEDEKVDLLKANPRGDWNRYFETHFDAKQAFETEHYISEETLRNFVRLNHAKRSGKKLRAMVWPRALTIEGGITRDILIDLCYSHGLEINHIRQDDIAFRNIAALLRMADLLDYDASRAPADLFTFIGLDVTSNAEQRLSRKEWDKNRSGGFQEIKNGVIRYNLVSDSLQLEKEIEHYIEYAQNELEQCIKKLHAPYDEWQRFKLPYKIEMTIQQENYKSGEFHITMDQDRVLELLTGNHLYEDASVFVRELLQNAIDAVLTRRAVEHHSNGIILVDTWNEDGDDWFRIEDDGTGMTVKIITDYFLKVGRSYYNSDEFRKEMYGKQAYTPISRFGIGILSCFMSDPENTMLEVSTLRYDHPENENAIRLNVDGLHGFYYLITGEEYGFPVKPLHRPQRAETEGPFRTKPGTTICVKTKLRHLGNYTSFREILDKYILCPDVKIVHRAWHPDGTFDQKIYITQQEVTRMIHAKNPDGPSQPPKEHAYLFPDDLYEEIKAKTPDFIWEKRPELVFQFYPMDWMDDNTGNLHGVAVCAGIRLSAHSVPVKLGGEDVIANMYSHLVPLRPRSRLDKIPYPKGEFSGAFSEGISKEVAALRNETEIIASSKYESFFQEYPSFKDDPFWIESMERQLGFSRLRFISIYMEIRQEKENALALKQQYGAVLDLCNRIEQKIEVSISAFFWQCVYTDPTLRLFLPLQKRWDNLYIKDNILSLASCNGISIPFPWNMNNDDFRFPRSSVCFMLAVFSGAYRPELELSREQISSVSPEVFHTWRFLSNMLPNVDGQCYYMNFGIGYMSKLMLTSERYYLEMMQRHPSWEKYLSCGQYISEEEEKHKNISFIQLACSIKSGNAPVVLEWFFDDFFLLDLAVLKNHFKVSMAFNDRGLIFVSEGKTDYGTLDFPPQMFFVSAQPTQHQCLGCVRKNSYNNFNPAHVFSKWLIANREAMLKDGRSAKIFNRLLEEMLMGKTRADVAKAIQYALEDLQKLPSNPFHIDRNLYVNEADLLQCSIPE